MALDRQAVEAALEKVRAALMTHGGSVDLVEVTDDDVVKVRLTGACGGCPMAAMTLRGVVEQALRREIPAIRAVVSA